MIRNILKISIAVIADIITLGGAVNEGYFKNGNRTYSAKAIKETIDEARSKWNTPGK